MRRLLANVHAEGYLAAITQICRGPDSREVWEHIGVETFRFADLQLDSTMTDAELWEFCQANLLLLVTANRSASGSDSLETTIRKRNTPESLPVITLANLRLFRSHRDYRERTAIGLLEILLDLDRLRGAGRLYVPSETKLAG